MTVNNTERNLRAGIAISLILLLTSSIVAYYTISKLIESSRLVDQTHQVLKVSEDIVSEIKDGETGQRGYLLSKQIDFLEPYNGSFQRAQDYIQELRKLTTDNLAQQLNCDTLSNLISRRYAMLDQLIEEAKNDMPVNVFRLRDGNQYMTQIRLIVKRMQHIEEALLHKRTVQQSRFIQFAPIAIVVAALFSLVITIFFFTRIMEESRRTAQLANSLREKNEETIQQISIIESVAAKLADGDYSTRLNAEESSTLGRLAHSLNKMALSLDNNFKEITANQWLQEGSAGLSETIAGEKNISELSEDAIAFITSYTGSSIGALYLANNDNSLSIAGGYALPAPVRNKRLQAGEGLPGQCLQSKQMIRLTDIADSLYTSFSSGDVRPRELLLCPILFEKNVIGVIEIGTLNTYDQQVVDFIQRISVVTGIMINMAQNRLRLKELLEETQAQAEELQAQHRELESINTELEIQAEKLQASEEELKVQQEELMETNQQLEERSRQLEEKNHLIVVRNLEIQKKAEELALSTRYKSEFLANMSHELRTPLNSVLLLARLLHENNTGNLTEEQIEYAQVIQNSGQSLLRLIDEILDLSKIESGKVDLDYEGVNVSDLVQNMRMLFQPMAAEKNLSFRTTVHEQVPGIIETDKQRLEQIIKNLVSNSLKFTQSGTIELIVAPSAKENYVDIVVADTGIGIPEDKQQLIFEAFQQADGSTRRKYGGTGLGLSISRQLARLLSGDITLDSQPDKGSRFTLTIPLFKPGKVTTPEANVEKPVEAKPVVAATVPEVPANYIANTTPTPLPDDRYGIGAGDKVLMIVEDDLSFAKALIDFARQKKYKVVHVVRGDEVFTSAITYKPIGILLDIQLPVKDGLSVMDELKKDNRTRSIPVHIMSSFEARKESLSRGAVAFITKPVLYEQMAAVLEKIEKAVNSDLSKVLIVEDNTQHAKALAYFLSTHNVQAEICDDIRKGMQLLQQDNVNCVILDMGKPGVKAYEALEIVKQNTNLENIPIIIFTGQSLSRSDEQRVRQYADTIVVKTAHSYERILNEVSLFLHLVDSPPERIAARMKGLGKLDEVLKNKTVLVADDDVRNIFALTKALEKHKMTVLPAIDGKEALKILEAGGKPDIILMDMMMPELDGYETISRIRSQPKWKRMPIIAVTAKAMSGDREKCLEAGASDYISKPVDTDQLLSLMRVWLYESV